MLRIVGGAIACLLLLAAGFFLWRGQARDEGPIPAAPEPIAASAPYPFRPETPPAASEATKEQKRFARADRDRDGRVEAGEMLAPRRKAFAKLDRDGNGSLSFEEWAAKTVEKFAEADKDRDGALIPAEYATTKAKARPKPKCRC